MIRSKLALTSVVLVVLLMASIAAVSAQEPNFVQTIAKVTQAPNIDGSLGDGTWVQSSIKGSKFVVDLHSSSGFLTTYPRIGYVGYDNDALYIAVVVYHPATGNMVTDASRPWNGDEVEIFLQPEGSPGYHQFIVSYANDKAHRTYGNVIARNIDFPSATQVDDIKWTVEVAIPFDELGHRPKSGDQWKMNLNGNQFSLGDGYIAWNPTYGSFLNPDRFATIIFE